MVIDINRPNLQLLHEVTSIQDDNVDAIVTLPSGEKRTLTFFTIKNIASIMESYKSTGECLSGRYFWAADMVIVTDLRRSTLEAVVTDMINNGELAAATGLGATEGNSDSRDSESR